MSYDLIYVEPTDKDISYYRELIKKQGNDVCQDKLDISVIKNASMNFTFGFLHTTTKAQIGRRKLNINDKYYLNGFIFCTYCPKIPDELYIELICSRKEKKLGKLLMKTCEEHVQRLYEPKIKKFTLNCLANNKLRTWYESIGFEYIREYPLPCKGAPKLFFMVKFLE
jgi:hypothetical protein